MRKLLGIVFIVFAMVLSYQWLREDWESEPAIVETITEKVQQTVKHTSELLKEELDRIQLEQTIEAGLSMDNSAAEAIYSEEKLSTKDKAGIISFLAEKFDERSPSVTFRIYGSYDDVSKKLSDWINEAFLVNEYARYALASYNYTITSKLMFTEVKLETVFRESKEMTEQVAQFSKELIAQMNLEALSDEEQVKLIHDWIITNVQYDQSLTRYTAYEAVMEGLAVCQGYAMLGYMLYSEAGFDVRIVEGTGKGEEHAWNMILLDDRWYQLDLTWDDPVGQAENDISYAYYLVSDQQLSADHVWKPNYPVAKESYRDVLAVRAETLEAGSASYEKVQLLRQELGLHWEDQEVTIESYQQLQGMLQESVKNRDHSVEFRYMAGEHVTRDVDKALRSLRTNLSYEMSYYDYSDSGDVIVMLDISY